MKKHNLFLVLSLALTANLFAQLKQDFDPEKITKILYQHSNDDLPGLAVGIVKDGQITYEHYLGYANLEHKIEVNKNTRFNIASNAKQFTALCILKLIDQGKLNLNDDFRKYLPGIHENIQHKITISNLLTHTSGIRDYCDLMALKGKSWWRQFIDNADVMELLKGQKDLNFIPGTEYVYSNSNYILLTEIVKEVTGQNFGIFAETMFEELDMTNTNFLTKYSEIIPNKARPYGNWNGWREEPTITDVHGDGALYTNLQDQLKWEQIVQENDGKYLSEKLINESQSPLNSSIENGYGYGLFFDTYNELNYVFHDGVTGAFNATFLRFPTEKLSIVVMSNNRNVPANYLAWQVVDQVMGLEKDNKAYPEDPEEIEEIKSIQDILGYYKKDEGSLIRITEKDGSVYREIYQRDPVKLINEEGGLFAYETIQGLKMNFTNIGQPDQKFTIYGLGQKPASYAKLPNTTLGIFDKNDLNGRFYNDETDTEIILQYVEDDSYTLTKNGRERMSKLIMQDYLRMMDSYHIKVIRDNDNNVIGLNVENRRIKNVIFNKTD
ncbi:MAG: serine hydrolase domain-containing protein [Bacteroidota bacterium]